MKNKNAFLLAEETVKIVIAVICIAFLAYFLISLYYSNIADEKKEHAENTLLLSEQSLKNVIENMEDSAEFQIIEPSNWHLFGFIDDKKPNICAGKNCLCICENVVDVLNRQINECNDEGVCLRVNLGEAVDIKIKKSNKGLTSILIEKKEGLIFISEK